MILLINYIKQNLSKSKTYVGGPMCDKFDNLIDEAYNSYLNEDRSKAIELLKTQMHWLIIQGIVDKEILLKFTSKQDRSEIHLLIDGRHEVKDLQYTVIDAEVRATGNSLVYAFGNSKITGFDTCNITTYDTSYASLKDCRGTGFNESTVIGRGYSFVECYDKSIGAVTGYSMIIAHDDSVVSSNSNSHLVDRR